MRECGSCSACCIELDIPDLNKAAGVRCKHLRLTGGCGVYATRGAVCRDFQCYFLTSNLPEAYRPNKSGLLAYVLSVPWHGEQGILLVKEIKKGAWDAGKEPFLQIAKEHLVYLVRPGIAETMLGPRKKLERVARWVKAYGIDQGQGTPTRRAFPA